MPEVKQVVSAAMGGFVRALSIGGRWYYDDPKNQNLLTRAYLHEISLVAIPADEDSLTNTPKPKMLPKSDLVNPLNGSKLVRAKFLALKLQMGVN